MITRLPRTLVMSLAPIALIACMNSAPTVAEEGGAVPLGVDLGGSGPMAASGMYEIKTITPAGGGR